MLYTMLIYTEREGAREREVANLIHIYIHPVSGLHLHKHGHEDAMEQFAAFGTKCLIANIVQLRGWCKGRV